MIRPLKYRRGYLADPHYTLRLPAKRTNSISQIYLRPLHIVHRKVPAVVSDPFEEKYNDALSSFVKRLKMKQSPDLDVTLWNHYVALNKDPERRSDLAEKLEIAEDRDNPFFTRERDSLGIPYLAVTKLRDSHTSETEEIKKQRDEEMKKLEGLPASVKKMMMLDYIREKELPRLFRTSDAEEVSYGLQFSPFSHEPTDEDKFDKAKEYFKALSALTRYQLDNDPTGFDYKKYKNPNYIPDYADEGYKRYLQYFDPKQQHLLATKVNQAELKRKVEMERKAMEEAFRKEEAKERALKEAEERRSMREDEVRKNALRVARDKKRLKEMKRKKQEEMKKRALMETEEQQFARDIERAIEMERQEDTNKRDMMDAQVDEIGKRREHMKDMLNVAQAYILKKLTDGELNNFDLTNDDMFNSFVEEYNNSARALSLMTDEQPASFKQEWRQLYPVSEDDLDDEKEYSRSYIIEFGNGVRRNAANAFGLAKEAKEANEDLKRHPERADYYDFVIGLKALAKNGYGTVWAKDVKDAGWLDNPLKGWAYPYLKKVKF